MQPNTIAVTSLELVYIIQSPLESIDNPSGHYVQRVNGSILCSH